MKTIPLRDEAPWGAGNHPDAMKPLTAFRRISVVCNDCGHAKVFDEADLQSLSAVPSFGMLAQHAHCSACRDAGVTGRPNVDFHTVLIEAHAAPSTRWSEKPVFTEDRSDPTPSLPRRSIFERRTTLEGA